jgi:hypothetical protein
MLAAMKVWPGLETEMPYKQMYNKDNIVCYNQITKFLVLNDNSLNLSKSSHIPHTNAYYYRLEAH